jgi:hypothetical protein
MVNCNNDIYLFNILLDGSTVHTGLTWWSSAFVCITDYLAKNNDKVYNKIVNTQSFIKIK